MKVRDLKQWDLFYNTNGYICLVYSIQGNSVYVVNTHGTFYAAKKNSDYDYRDDIPNMTVSQYFKIFPESNLSDWRDKQKLKKIKAIYFTGQLPNKKRLLLLC